MNCPELYITHVWQHITKEQGPGLSSQFKKHIHDGNSVECKTRVFYSPHIHREFGPNSLQFSFAENYMKWLELHRYLMVGNLHPMEKAIGPYH